MAGERGVYARRRRDWDRARISPRELTRPSGYRAVLVRSNVVLMTLPLRRSASSSSRSSAKILKARRARTPRCKGVRHALILPCRHGYPSVRPLRVRRALPMLTLTRERDFNWRQLFVDLIDSGE